MLHSPGVSESNGSWQSLVSESELHNHISNNPTPSAALTINIQYNSQQSKESSALKTPLDRSMYKYTVNERVLTEVRAVE